MKVIITAEAEADLENIGDHIALADRRRAVTFVQTLTEQCRGLADMPFRFSLIPRYETSGIRRRTHGKYLIFYRVGADRIDVLHVLHGAQDYQAILFPEA